MSGYMYLDPLFIETSYLCEIADEQLLWRNYNRVFDKLYVFYCIVSRNFLHTFYAPENSPKNFLKKISTHLLTVLIMRVIVQTEQRKRNKKTGFQILSFHLLTTLETTSRVLMAAMKTAHKNFNLMFQHERRNDL